MGVVACTHQNCIKDMSLLLSISVNGHYVPLTGLREIRPLCDTLYLCLRHAHPHIHTCINYFDFVVETFIKTVMRQTWWKRNHLEMNMSEQVKVVSIEPEVPQQLRVVHVVWVVRRHGEITETHHLFGGVDHQGAIDAGSLWLKCLLWTQRETRHTVELIRTFYCSNSADNHCYAQAKLCHTS